VGHGLDPGGVDRPQLIDQAENPVQALDRGRRFLGPDTDSRKVREPAYLVVRKRHEMRRVLQAFESDPGAFAVQRVVLAQ
jgi:hypothetical protein